MKRVGMVVGLLLVGGCGLFDFGDSDSDSNSDSVDSRESLGIFMESSRMRASVPAGLVARDERFMYRTQSCGCTHRGEGRYPD